MTVDFADKVSITPGKNEDLETTGTLAVSPIRSTYYTLTATNLHGSSTYSLMVEVIPEQSLAISEFMAENESTLADGRGQFEDWIEIENISPVPVALDDYHLTDDILNPNKWRLPEHELAPGKRILFFASGQDFQDTGGFHHTNFKLQNAGEYLALTPQRISQFLNFILLIQSSLLISLSE